jgi:hypothetical protein
MIDASKVSAIVVTQGGDDLAPVLGPLCDFSEIIIWDNSCESDQKVFGRFAALVRARNEVIYVQDDDCVVPTPALLSEYENDKLVCNLPEAHRKDYVATGISLIGFGAIFHRSLVDFSPYLSKFPRDDLFLRECDRVFTYLNRDRTKLVDVGVTKLDRSYSQNRMWLEERHWQDLEEVRRRLMSL